MAKKVKDYYDFEYAGFLAEKINSEYPAFDSDRFISLLREGGLEKLEFNDRQRLLASALKACIPLPYAETLEIFSKILGPELKGSLGMFSEGFWLWPIGKYVEIFGADSFDKSETAVVLSGSPRYAISWLSSQATGTKTPTANTVPGMA